MIKNIIFDLGNVLLNFDSNNIIANHIKDKSIHEEISDNIFKSKEWIKLDKGLISAQEATNIFVKRQPENENLIKEIMINWKKYLKPIHENVEVLYYVAANSYNLYVLSNFHKEAFEEVYNKYDFFKCFDGMIISYKEKTVKPEKEIYKILVNRYKIIPEESLFIDDNINNIKVAQKLGFKTIHFNDNIRLKDKIADYIKE